MFKLVSGVVSLGVLGALLTAACDDTSAMRHAPHRVDCYSGERLIYTGTSSGRVWIDNGHVSFLDGATGRSTNVIGSCIVVRLDPPLAEKQDVEAAAP